MYKRNCAKSGKKLEKMYLLVRLKQPFLSRLRRQLPSKGGAFSLSLREGGAQRRKAGYFSRVFPQGSMLASAPTGSTYSYI